MGLREWAAKAPLGMYGPIRVYKDRIAKGKEEYGLEGVTARVEAGSDLQPRVTATRLVALGVFAFAAKKKSGGECYLTIEGPDFFWSEEVDRKQRAGATQFAATINQAARSSA